MTRSGSRPASFAARRPASGDGPSRGGAERGRGRAVHFLVEDVHRQGEKDRPARRSAADREGAAQRLPHILAAAQFLGPFGHRRSKRNEIARKPWLAHEVPGVLLAGGDDEGRLARLGGDQHAHGVA
jgi:hypothetical protein